MRLRRPTGTSSQYAACPYLGIQLHYFQDRLSTKDLFAKRVPYQEASPLLLGISPREISPESLVLSESPEVTDMTQDMF